LPAQAKQHGTFRYNDHISPFVRQFLYGAPTSSEPLISGSTAVSPSGIFHFNQLGRNLRIGHVGKQADAVAISATITIVTSVRTPVLTSSAGFLLGHPARQKSIARSIIETRKTLVRHPQRATLVGLKRNFLCQHHVA